MLSLSWLALLGFVSFRASAFHIQPGLLHSASPWQARASRLSALDGSNPSGFQGYQQPETKRGAYDAAREEAASRGLSLPAIILVNPFLDQNVGSVSRAMLNFGLTELRVVDPRCDILSESARALSSGSELILENAKIFPTLKEAIWDLERVFATTIRPRHMTQMVLSPQAAAKAAITQHREQGSTATSCGIVFGRERNGLTNEEVAICDTIVTIPTFKHFSSINLAQACNIMCSELWKRQIELEGVAPPEEWLHPRDGERMARRDDLETLFQRLEAKLTEKNYQLDDKRRDLNYRNIRNLLQRILCTRAEVDLLQGVLSALVKPSYVMDDQVRPAPTVAPVAAVAARRPALVSSSSSLVDEDEGCPSDGACEA